jgi:hypothetical protein
MVANILDELDRWFSVSAPPKEHSSGNATQAETTTNS